MKTKTFKSEVMDVAEKGIVTIAISKFNVEDAGGDMTHKGAFTKTFQEGGNRIKHYMDHSLKQSANVGLPVKMYEDANYAIVESALNLEKEISRDLFSDYKFFKANGKTLEHSYGYETIKGKARTKGEDIFELKMYEYSTVGLGMNEHTPLLGLKSLEDLVALEGYLKKYDVSEYHAKKIQKIIKLMKKLQQPEPTEEKSKSLYALDLSVKSTGSLYNLKLN